MHITRLRLYHFRNFPELEASFTPRLNMIVGRNAQGKTNLIEAINLISAGRSFRTSQMRELIQWGTHEMSVFTEVQEAAGTLELGMAVTPEGKTCYLNKDQTSTPAFIGRLCCVTFTPNDLALVKGSPEGRRKFIDRHAADITPGLIRDMLDFNRALRSKNKILKGRSANRKMLQPWNEIMARTAVRIAAGRRSLIQRVQSKAEELHKLFESSGNELRLQYKTTLGAEPGAPSYEQIIQRLEEAQDRELMLHTSLIGPHRDDVVIWMGRHDAKSFASQGQSRSIVLAIKLAVIAVLEEARGESPVVLLDDVDSELDGQRREALYELIMQQERQVFVTGTDCKIAELCGGGSVVRRLENGALSAPEP